MYPTHFRGHLTNSTDSYNFDQVRKSTINLSVFTKCCSTIYFTDSRHQFTSGWPQTTAEEPDLASRWTLTWWIIIIFWWTYQTPHVVFHLFPQWPKMIWPKKRRQSSPKEDHRCHGNIMCLEIVICNFRSFIARLFVWAIKTEIKRFMNLQIQYINKMKKYKVSLKNIYVAKRRKKRQWKCKVGKWKCKGEELSHVRLKS